MKYRLLFLLAVLSLQASFSQSVEKNIDNNIPVNEHNVPLQKGQYYFPLTCFPTTELSQIVKREEDSMHRIEFKLSENVYDTFLVEWYSGHLFALQEPLLFNKPVKNEIYRFTWLRTWRNPIAISIEKKEDTYRLRWKRCDGAGGYDPGKLVTNQSKEIAKKDWDTFISLLEACDFWNIELIRDPFGRDGAEWILEGNDPQNYRAMSDWSPDEGPYYEACYYLIELARITLNEGARF